MLIGLLLSAPSSWCTAITSCRSNWSTPAPASSSRWRWPAVRHDVPQPRIVRRLVSLLHRRHFGHRAFDPRVRCARTICSLPLIITTTSLSCSCRKAMPLPTELMLTRRGDSLILRTPILSENQYPDETADGGSHPTTTWAMRRSSWICSRCGCSGIKVFVSTLLLLLCMCIAIPVRLPPDARRDRPDPQHGEHRRPHPPRPARQPRGGATCSASCTC